MITAGWGLVLAVAGGILLIAAIAAGPVMSLVDEPEYKIVEKSGKIEVRDYVPVVVAEIEVSGERREAINAGFRALADYIFGNNAKTQKIAMTAPVVQEEAGPAGAKIAMTAPVMQEPSGTNWKVRFVMPAEYTIETIPKPGNPAVTLSAVSARRFAVIRFRGTSRDGNISPRREELMAFVFMRGFKTRGEPVLAFYNPPWTLPFLRRNEVMVEIEESGPAPQ